MKVSLSWLNEYTPIEMNTADLAEALTMAGLEVESVSDRFGYLDSVYVGRIDAVEAHPDADKLKVCHVDIGQRKVAVVCGAPNAGKDMLAPLALPGTVFPDGSILEESVIRGQKSQGMLCSEAELGLGLDKSGLWVLDPALNVGGRLADALNLSDAVIEIDLTPNRPDCLSVIGVAREVAVIQNTPLNYPDFKVVDQTNKAAKMTSVRIEAPDHCPRYSARLVVDVRVGASPFWLQDKLMSIGVRPINNIVDITNYVLMETGQPLHAFDYDQLAENRIVVRTANQGESFVTLDEKERLLDSEMLMICDGEKPVAVGGVMGGLNSEIETATSRVLIESAYFNPVSIRKTSKKLGLNTEASHRFERGIDPEGTIAAVNRAATLMVEIAGGTLIDGLIDEYPAPQNVENITLSVGNTNRVLGTNLGRREIEGLLTSIGFKVDSKAAKDNPDELAVRRPSFRVDVSRPEDLKEEIARLSGYNKIPTTFPEMPAEGRRPSPRLDLRNRIKTRMSGLGFTEAVTYSFGSHAASDRLGFASDDPRRSVVAILNPLTEDQAIMRTSMIPGLLETMHYNMAQQVKNLKIFEIGKTFIAVDDAKLPQETEILAGLWTGARYPASWHGREIACDYYDIKGVVEALLDELKIENLLFTGISVTCDNYMRAGHTARILAGEKVLGQVGEIHSQVGVEYDLKQPAYIFELDVDRIIALVSEAKYAKPVPKYPAVFRDITIIVNREFETQAIMQAVDTANEELIECLTLFDVFEGDPIPSGKKSISFHVTYRSSRKTLVDEDINQLHKSITEKLMEAFDATLPV